MSVAGLTSYTMRSSNTITEEREGGRGNQQIILKYQDGTEWIFLNNRGKERFCGFLYLEKAINDVGLKTIKAAENKIAIRGSQIIYLSRYCGEEKPGFMEFHEELS